MPQSEHQTACDRVLAHYRERCGAAWRPADDILFRAAWAEGAHERDRQLRDEVKTRAIDDLTNESRALRARLTKAQEHIVEAGNLIVQCNRELLAASCPLTAPVFAAIERYLSKAIP